MRTDRQGGRGKRLWIYQPYVPAYRVPFFEGLRAALEDDATTLRVVIPRDHDDARGDAVTDLPWIRQQASHGISLRGRRFQMLVPPTAYGERDAVVVGLQGTLPDAYRLLARPRRTYKVGVWGHVETYVGPVNRWDAALERWQMRRSDQVFAYTPGGARVAAAAGIGAVKITTVMNSVSVDYLGQGVRDVASAQDAHSTLAYVGALDSSKRIDFLAAALDELWSSNPEVRLLVAGEGAQAALLDIAVSRGQVEMLGYGDGATKAKLAESCGAFLMPGRIGLVAVETLAMGRPIVTTDWKYHAPEAEYLVEGASVFTTPDDPRQFAAVAVAAARRERAEWPHPTLDQMIVNFRVGVNSMFAA